MFKCLCMYIYIYIYHRAGGSIKSNKPDGLEVQKVILAIPYCMGMCLPNCVGILAIMPDVGR